MAAVTIASTLEHQLPDDPWNQRPNQLALINPDDYSPIQPVQVVKNLRSTKKKWGENIEQLIFFGLGGCHIGPKFLTLSVINSVSKTDE